MIISNNKNKGKNNFMQDFTVLIVCCAPIYTVSTNNFNYFLVYSKFLKYDVFNNYVYVKYNLHSTRYWQYFHIGS